ncbi:hypothetical protein ACXR2T_09955 [Leucobacter sp. HY1910]
MSNIKRRAAGTKQAGVSVGGQFAATRQTEASGAALVPSRPAMPRIGTPEYEAYVAEKDRANMARVQAERAAHQAKLDRYAEGELSHEHAEAVAQAAERYAQRDRSLVIADAEFLRTDSRPDFTRQEALEYAALDRARDYVEDNLVHITDEADQERAARALAARMNQAVQNGPKPALYRRKRDGVIVRRGRSVNGFVSMYRVDNGRQINMSQQGLAQKYERL